MDAKAGKRARSDEQEGVGDDDGMGAINGIQEQIDVIMAVRLFDVCMRMFFLFILYFIT